MKKYLFSFLLLFVSILTYGHGGSNYVHSDFFASMKPGDKAALLMVHFGTTYNDTRTKTIDAINQKVKATYPKVEFREAWTSRIVLRRLKAKGFNKQNPHEALEALRSEGYTHVLIQSSNIIEGVEMESLHREVLAVKKYFKDIRLGNPLLYEPEDYEKVIDIITKKGIKNGATVLVGHGTYSPTTAQYAMFDYMLKAKGYKNFIVGTLEGYPTYDNMLAQLKALKVKNVLLMPFMFVAGDHASNDIAGDWKEKLEKEGFKVDVLMEGLGQDPDIQNLFIDHIEVSVHHKKLDILDKKATYSKDKD